MFILQIVPPRPTILPGPFDTGGAEALSNIGRFLSRLVNPEGAKRREIQEQIRAGNVELLQTVAQAARSSEEALFSDLNAVADATTGALDAAITMLGLDPNNRANQEFFRSLMAASPATFEEQLGRERRAKDIAGLTGEAEKLSLEGQILTLPETAQAQLAKLRAEKEQSSFNERLFNTMNALDVPELQGQIGLIEALARKSEIELDNQMREGIVIVYETLLQKNPGEAARFLAAMRAPEYLRDIQHRETLSLRESIAKWQLEAQKAKTEEDLAKAEFKHYMEVSDSIIDLFQAAQEAREGGDRNTINAAFSTLENHIRYFEERWPGATSVATELRKDEVRGRSVPSAEVRSFEDETVSVFADAAVRHVAVGGTLREFEEANPEVMQALNKLDQVGDFRRQVLQRTGAPGEENLITETVKEVQFVGDIINDVVGGVQNFIERGGLIGAAKRLGQRPIDPQLQRKLEERAQRQKEGGEPNQ